MYKARVEATGRERFLPLVATANGALSSTADPLIAAIAAENRRMTESEVREAIASCAVRGRAIALINAERRSGINHLHKNTERSTTGGRQHREGQHDFRKAIDEVSDDDDHTDKPIPQNDRTAHHHQLRPSLPAPAQRPNMTLREAWDIASGQRPSLSPAPAAAAHHQPTTDETPTLNDLWTRARAVTRQHLSHSPSPHRHTPPPQQLLNRSPQPVTGRTSSTLRPLTPIDNTTEAATIIRQQHHRGVSRLQATLQYLERRSLSTYVAILITFAVYERSPIGETLNVAPWLSGPLFFFMVQTVNPLVTLYAECTVTTANMAIVLINTLILDKNAVISRVSYIVAFFSDTNVAWTDKAIASFLIYGAIVVIRWQVALWQQPDYELFAGPATFVRLSTIATFITTLLGGTATTLMRGYFARRAVTYGVIDTTDAAAAVGMHAADAVLNTPTSSFKTLLSWLGLR